MNYFQVAMPLLGNVKTEPEILPERLEYLLEEIKDEATAIQFACQRAGRNQTNVGEELGLQKSHWSGICNGTKNMSWKLRDRFCDLVNNDILLQWWAVKRGYRLVKRKPSEKQKMEQQLAQMEQRLTEAEQENEKLRANQRQ